MSTSKSYSKIESNTTVVYKYKNMPITQQTINTRNKIKASLDKFTSFSWRGFDAWDNFGAFIINEKNSLKFFNGATWSNSYSKPQFSSQVGQLTGMDFKVPTLSFTMGVYWFSEEEYRYLLDWLSPYEINALSFGFSDKYYYQVKLASVSQGTRYVIGHEQEVEDTDNHFIITSPRYYTEIQLSFELQGPMCAFNKDAVQWTLPADSIYFTISDANYYSDLEFPIIANFTIKTKQPNNETPSDINQTSHFSFYVQVDNKIFELFSCEFQNLTYDGQQTIQLQYTSEDGLVFWRQGDSKHRLLTSLSTLSSGKRLVRQIETTAFKLPGRFNMPNINRPISDFTFAYKCDNNIIVESGLSNNMQTYINARSRTNVI